MNDHKALRSVRWRPCHTGKALRSACGQITLVREFKFIASTKAPQFFSLPLLRTPFSASTLLDHTATSSDSRDGLRKLRKKGDLGTKKLSKLATVHVVKRDSASTSGSRVTNENKLLTSKHKFKPATTEFKKCQICKKMVHHVQAHYCQSCAYQKAICAFCGKKMMETRNYRQSLV